MVVPVYHFCDVCTSVHCKDGQVCVRSKQCTTEDLCPDHGILCMGRPLSVKHDTSQYFACSSHLLAECSRPPTNTMATSLAHGQKGGGPCLNYTLFNYLLFSTGGGWQCEGKRRWNRNFVGVSWTTYNWGKAHHPSGRAQRWWRSYLWTDVNTQPIHR